MQLPNKDYDGYSGRLNEWIIRESYSTRIAKLQQYLKWVDQTATQTAGQEWSEEIITEARSASAFALQNMLYLASMIGTLNVDEVVSTSADREAYEMYRLTLLRRQSTEMRSYHTEIESENGLLSIYNYPRLSTLRRQSTQREGLVGLAVSADGNPHGGFFANADAPQGVIESAVFTTPHNSREAVAWIAQAIVDIVPSLSATILPTQFAGVALHFS